APARSALFAAQAAANGYLIDNAHHPDPRAHLLLAYHAWTRTLGPALARATDPARLGSDIAASAALFETCYAAFPDHALAIGQRENLLRLLVEACGTLGRQFKGSATSEGDA